MLRTLRKNGATWTEVAIRLNKKRTTCYARWATLQSKEATRNWTREDDEALKKAYHLAKPKMWRSVADLMNFEGDWRVVEAKVFELGLKQMKWHGISVGKAFYETFQLRWYQFAKNSLALALSDSSFLPAFSQKKYVTGNKLISIPEMAILE